MKGVRMRGREGGGRERVISVIALLYWFSFWDNLTMVLVQVSVPGVLS